MNKMFLLFQKSYDDESFELQPILISDDKSKIKNYLQNLLKKSESYDRKVEKHICECKHTIKCYLSNNKDAVCGWKNTRKEIDDREKDRIIGFLSDNYSYSRGKNIVEVSDNFIERYCDVEKLSRPYPRLPKYPKTPSPYHRREWFFIREVKILK